MIQADNLGVPVVKPADVVISIQCDPLIYWPFFETDAVIRLEFYHVHFLNRSFSWSRVKHFYHTVNYPKSINI